MQGFPHRYSVNASAKKDGLVLLDSPGAAQLSSAPPIEFDGPGDQWSPESLLTASVADCIILTFRAIAKASSLEWSELDGACMCPNPGALSTAPRLLELRQTFRTHE